MSKPFETELATWVYSQFSEQGVVEGDRYRADFPNGETADGFAAALFEIADHTTTEISYEGTTEEIVTFTIDGTPVHFARVQPSGDQVSEPYEISRWYGSTLRTVLSDNEEFDAALFLVFEEGETIETLDATEELFISNELLPLRAFKKKIFTDFSDLDSPGEAFLRAIQELLVVPDENVALMNDIAPLSFYCEALQACREQDTDAMGALLPRLDRVVRTDRGPFMRETDFEGWFNKKVSVKNLQDQSFQLINKNEEMCELIDDCLGTTKDERAELSAHFTDKFVDRILSTSNWQEMISKNEAQKGLADEDGPNNGGSGLTGTGTGTGPSTPGTTTEGASPTPSFKQMSFNGAESRILPQRDNDNEWRHIIDRNEGTFELTCEFSSDISSEPIRLQTPGDTDSDAYELDGDTLKFSRSGLNTAEPTFYQLDVYLGHQRRMGTPACRFSIAMVPAWFFDSLADEVYQVDIENDTLTVPDSSPINLNPPSAADDAERVIRDVKNSGETVQLTQPLFIRPKPVSKIERLEIQIATPDAKVPVDIHFLSGDTTSVEEEVRFPLSFETIVNPEDWDSTDLVRGPNVIINTAQGKITSPTREPFRIPELDHDLLQFEETLRNDGSISPRQIDSSELDGSTTGSPAEGKVSNVDSLLLEAYEELFDHFEANDTVPSTDPWDADTCDVVEDVLDVFLTVFNSFEQDESPLIFSPYRQLGTIESTVADKVWLTPYHPLMLAYGLQIARWRQQLVNKGQTAGFRSTRFDPLFSPAGLFPYRWSKGRNGVLSGQEMGNHRLWVAYSPPEGFGTETPNYIDTEVETKLDAFYRAFPALFEIHPERRIDINIVSLGDLAEVVEGLYDFYKFTEQYDQVEPPRIRLRLYGGSNQGEAIEQFFGTDTYSELADDLESRDSRANTDIVDIIQNRVTYLHESDPFIENPKPAHLTFFRGLLNDEVGTFDTAGATTGVRVGGLLPREELDVKAIGSGAQSKTGIVLSDSSPHITDRVGHVLNAMEAGIRDAGLDRNQSLCKVVEFGSQDLSSVWDHSLWVSHIEPQVGLDFYIKSSAEATGDTDGALMIHYSDQYDSTPGFDVITLTNKRDPYLRALQRELNQSPGLEAVNPNTVLTRLVAIDGELALDIQRAEGNSVTELLGFVGGLAVASYLLDRDLPEYEWIPISLNEFARHDRQYRRAEDGLLQFTDRGKATDDLCFIGIPTANDDEPLELKLWPVETKGGSANITKGVDQIQGGKEKLSKVFHPDEPFADTQILYSEFGNVVTKIAQRLYYYGVIDDPQIDALDDHQDALVEGDYHISFLQGSEGAIGDVVRIQPDIAVPEPGFRENVRVLKLPLETLRMVNDTDIPTVPDFISRLEIGFTSTQGSQDDTETVDEDGVLTNARSIDPGDGPKTVANDNEGGTANTHDGEPTSPRPEDTGDSEEFPSSTEAVPTDSGGQRDDSAEEPSGASSEADDTDQEQAKATTGTPDTDPLCEEHDQADKTDALLQQLSGSESPSTEVDAGKLTSSLKEKFESLGVNIHQPNPADVSIGPRKIGVNVHPKGGQKISGILNNLDSISVHIQASGTITGVPVPAEGAVRLAIPHGEVYTVGLQSGFEANGDLLRTPLHIPLGVTTEMEHVTIDLLEQHHLLIGGATGSGKSNFLSTVIASLAIGNDPKTVQMSILDPKGLDFGKFETLPHVDRYIDHPNESAAFLTELLDTEVEERRSRLQQIGASSVKQYNELAESNDFEKIPYRVILIDEYADLSMAVDDESKLETAITRLAQIGRALGYSILLATQRPDAEIVSGKIKTNFQPRIAFELPTGTDSRVILDQNGAEDLQGDGDMIAKENDGTEHRLQGYYLPLEDALAITDLFMDSG